MGNRHVEWHEPTMFPFVGIGAFVLVQMRAFSTTRRRGHVYRKEGSLVFLEDEHLVQFTINPTQIVRWRYLRSTFLEGEFVQFQDIPFEEWRGHVVGHEDDGWVRVETKDGLETVKWDDIERVP